MNNFARSLPGGGHYSSVFGWWTIGNYDVSVAELALRSQGLHMRWHDARAGAAGVDLKHGKARTFNLSGGRLTSQTVALCAVSDFLSLLSFFFLLSTATPEPSSRGPFRVVRCASVSPLAPFIPQFHPS